MGMSSDAYLVYGIALSEGVDFEEFSNDDPLSPKRLSYKFDFESEGYHIINHCCDSEPMYILSYGKINWASRGEVVSIDSFEIPPDADFKIREYIDKYQLETEGTIGWKLVSYCGI